MFSMRKCFETATNIAILLVCGAILWTIFGPKLHSPSNTGEDASLKGVSLSVLPGYDWRLHQSTLVLAIRKGCHFCESSLPFYKHLSQLEQDKDLTVHLLAVMPDDKASAESLLKVGGVSIDGVFDFPLSSLHVSSTPTLLLVDANGRVDKAWVGELSPKGEEDVISDAKRDIVSARNTRP